MSWEISHSPKVWDDLRQTIRDMYAADYETAHEWLCEALAYARCATVEHDGIESWKSALEQKMTSLVRLTPDVIEDAIIEQIQETNTTSNGGFDFYIDRNGWYTITPKDKQ